MPLVQIGISLLVFTLLFAVIYKVLPDAHISWSDVWVGATITSLLFLVGQWLIALYLSRTALASMYGAFGSVFILLIWVYYSCQIFFVGAEFTKIYARHFGSHALQRVRLRHVA